MAQGLAHSKLKSVDTNQHESLSTVNLAELYATNAIPDDVYPLKFKTIQREQQKDNSLLRRSTQSPTKYTVHSFHGGGKVRQLICKDGKIVIPKTIQKNVVGWYHTTLCHPGITRMEDTIQQHFTWDSIRDDIRNVCRTCHTCQITKKSHIKHGQIPVKEDIGSPWETLCVDLIGPYTIHRKGTYQNGKQKNDITLWCVTMIDPVTNWLEIAQIKTKRADVIANKVEQTWFNRYPWPTKVVLDRGTEFMAEFTEMIKKDYGIKKKPITTRNPQANGILERVHQTIGSMIKSFRVHDAELDEEDPWAGILGAVMFATRATIHHTNRATPTQLVFGRDAILNVTHEANWHYIKQRKRKITTINNVNENKKRTKYIYQKGDNVLSKLPQTTKYGSDAYDGPYKVMDVHTNGTLSIKKGAVTDKINIRNVKPYHECISEYGAACSMRETRSMRAERVHSKIQTNRSCKQDSSQRAIPHSL